jgi:hypothetical protein
MLNQIVQKMRGNTLSRTNQEIQSNNRPPGGDGTGDGSVGGGNKYNLSFSSQFPYFCRLFITYLFISRQDAYSVLNFEYIKNQTIDRSRETDLKTINYICYLLLHCRPRFRLLRVVVFFVL